MRRLFALVGAVLAAACLPLAAHAQTYPTQTVRIVVPAPAGSTTDILARIVADQLAKKWGSATIIDNIGGGAMNIGARTVARAASPAPLDWAVSTIRFVEAVTSVRASWRQFQRRHSTWPSSA